MDIIIIYDNSIQLGTGQIEIFKNNISIGFLTQRDCKIINQNNLSFDYNLTNGKWEFITDSNIVIGEPGKSIDFEYYDENVNFILPDGKVGEIYTISLPQNSNYKVKSSNGISIISFINNELTFKYISKGVQWLKIGNEFSENIQETIVSEFKEGFYAVYDENILGELNLIELKSNYSKIGNGVVLDKGDNEIRSLGNVINANLKLKINGSEKKSYNGIFDDTFIYKAKEGEVVTVESDNSTNSNVNFSLYLKN